MPRYIVEDPTIIQPLQAGDYPQPLTFIVPEALNMFDRTAEFFIHNKNGDELVHKDGSSVVVTDQTIEVNFEQEDTINLFGPYNWFLKTTDSDELITIAYGVVQIKKTK